MFLGYIHYFRALAIFFIIMGHSIDIFIWNDIYIERTLRILLSNGTVLFVFIAGYLFQHLSSKFDTKKYFKSKIKNVITPYFIVSIPAIVIFTTILERDMWAGFYDNSILEQVGLFYLTGKHLAALWFIPMIAIFYVIAPILVKTDKNKTIYFCLPLFIALSCFVSRGGFPPQKFIHFFSAYLLGMYCSKFKEIINPLISRNIFIAFTFTLMSFFAVYEFLFMEGTFTYINYLQKLSICIFFLGLFIKFNSYLNSKFISVIADTSFGVFFIHSYYLASGKLLYLKINGEPAVGNLVLYFIIGISSLLICTLIITLIKRGFGKHSKLFVGS